MFFILSKILWIVAKPSSLLIIGAVLGAILRARRLLWTCLIVIAAAGFTPLPQWVAAPLEDRFPQPDLSLTPPDGIIVLGGAIQLALSGARDQVQLNAHGERLVAAAALARQFPGARILFTGGSGALAGEEGSPADFARAYFAATGIDPGRMMFEGRSRNTYENVAFSRKLAEPQPGEHWVLVTSAFHMPRAVGAFRKLDWPVTPYPVDYATFPFQDRSQVTWSVAGGLAVIDDTVHEYIGLMAYYLTGRIDGIFPGP